MGNSSHKKTAFFPDSNIDGQDQRSLIIFESIHLSNSDVSIFFQFFQELDRNHSGWIRPMQLYNHLNIEFGQFEKHIFSIFDVEDTGMINFSEFVCGFWNFLSLPELDIAGIVYIMKDPTGKLAVRFKDMVAALETIHKKKVGSSHNLQIIVDTLMARFPFEITLVDFNSWYRSNLTALSPVEILQIKLRRMILGERSWVKYTDMRKQVPAMSSVKFMLQLKEQLRPLRNPMAVKSAVIIPLDNNKLVTRKIIPATMTTKE